MSAPNAPANAVDAIEKAYSIIQSLNDGKTRWRMSVPVQMDDPDVALGTCLNLLRDRIADDAKKIAALEKDARRWQLALAFSILEKDEDMGEPGLQMVVTLGSLSTMKPLPSALRAKLDGYYLHEEDDIRTVFDLAMPVDAEPTEATPASATGLYDNLKSAD